MARFGDPARAFGDQVAFDEMASEFEPVGNVRPAADAAFAQESGQRQQAAFMRRPRARCAD
jgi:hypothetical protein